MADEKWEESDNKQQQEIVSVEEQEEFLRIIKQLNLVKDSQVNSQELLVPQVKSQQDYKFWSTQPVPSIDDDTQEHGAVDKPKQVKDVRQDPYNMPKGFIWSDIDLNDPKQAEELYELLTKNYVEDDDNMFRFDYSLNFLVWALKPPGYRSNWHVGVRNEKNNKLMAFISAVPAKVRVYDQTMKMAEVNFLCVHKKLRAKRLAPVLIKEVTRRVNLTNTWQAVYTAGVVLPRPVAQCRYFHRSLNPKKLIEVGFSRLAPRMTMARTVKMYRLPENPLIPGFRQMASKDVPAVTKLLKEYHQKFKLVPLLNQEEVAHLILPREGVLNSYVVEDPTTHQVTDFCSFYHLPSTIIGNEKHKSLNAAYSFYNVATSVSLENLMQDCLIMARKDNFDVFNALNLMDNRDFLSNLKFGIGDGELQYYLYNWKCPRMEPQDVGIVLC